MGQCVNKLTGQSGISDQEIGFEWRLGRKGAGGGELRSHWRKGAGENYWLAISRQYLRTVEQVST
jgi:hypothetical protein